VRNEFDKTQYCYYTQFCVVCQEFPIYEILCRDIIRYKVPSGILGDPNVAIKNYAFRSPGTFSNRFFRRNVKKVCGMTVTRNSGVDFVHFRFRQYFGYSDIFYRLSSYLSFVVITFNRIINLSEPETY